MIEFGDGDKLASFYQKEDGSVAVTWRQMPEPVGPGNKIPLELFDEVEKLPLVAEWTFKNRECALVVLEVVSRALACFKESNVIRVHIKKQEDKVDECS